MENLFLEVKDVGIQRPARDTRFSIKKIKFEDIITGKEHITILRSSENSWNLNFKVNQIWEINPLTVQEKISKDTLILPDALDSAIFTQECCVKENYQRYARVEDTLKFKNQSTLLELKKISILGNYKCFEVKDYQTTAFECNIYELKDREIAKKYFINLKHLK